MTERRNCCCGNDENENKEKDVINENNCGCGCNEEEEYDIVTLTMDDDSELECAVIGIFEVEGKEYIALLALDGSEEIYLYGYKEINEEEFELEDIENDEEYENVAAAFEVLFIDEDDEESDDE